MKNEHILRHPLPLPPPVMHQTAGGLSPVPGQYRLLGIDGTSLVRTVFEAIPKDMDIGMTPEALQAKVAGYVTEAMKSAMGSVKRALREFNPTHALVVFDGPKIVKNGVPVPDWRQQLHPGYKAHRKPSPAELGAALPGLMSDLKAIGVTSACVPGTEGDDALASLVHHWKPRSRGPAIILSSDKDLAQLLVHGALTRDHFRRQWRGEDWVRERFDIAAEQLTDYLAMAGDETDGIPGIRGVGPKTASKLLREYGTLDSILAAAPGIKGKLGERLMSAKQEAALSRKLVQLRTDVNLGCSISALRFNGSVIGLPAPRIVPGAQEGGKGAATAASGRRISETVVFGAEPEVSSVGQGAPVTATGMLPPYTEEELNAILPLPPAASVFRSPRPRSV
jgi:5'-3' exonuclease